MPLTRATVTIASRVMLPVDLVFFAIVAVSFLTTPLDRLRATPGLEYVDDVSGIRFVGCIFAAAALLLAAAMLRQNRKLAQMVLGGSAAWLAIFAVAMVGAAVFDQASWSAWAWPAYVASACWASLLSLESREA